MGFSPALGPFDFNAGFFTELDALLGSEPVDSFNDFNHLTHCHFAGTLTEHHNAAIQPGGHALLLFF